MPAVALFGADKAEQKAAPRFTPRIHFPLKSVISPGIRAHMQRPEKGATIRKMLDLPPHVKSTGTPARPTDPGTIQRNVPRAMPDPLLSFEGVGDVNGVEPADTTMAVGPNHVVQWVNLSFEVFDRLGNDLSGGPVNALALWSDLSSACSTFNGGDIIVHYDYLADRWFFAQLAYPSDFHNCIAVSLTPDPLGPLAEYDYLYSPTHLNDYPKWGLWPDAYYGTFRDFTGFGPFNGMTVWAIDRNALLAGDPSPTVLEVPFGVIDPNQDGLLPSDLSGGGLGPPGASPSVGVVPNTLAGIGSPAYDGSPNSMVHLYQFHPDFVTPPNSTFTGPVNLTVADFDFNVTVTGPSSSGMESLPFPLYRLDYRNFGDHEAIVFNHTVNDGTGIAGVRWYEIRDPRGTPTLFQQGTFAPGDGIHRWFGSAAVDVSGDIAMGYSTTNATVAPSINYAGRLVGDPLGQLSQGETQLVAGDAPFFGGRWGDYSTIVVDPTDQCTFWFTTMYSLASTGGDWSTRVGSFKFPSCTAGPHGTLEGTVTDGTNPLVGAKITVSPGGASATTDASGHYTMTLPVGTYDLVASKYGFFPGTANGVGVTDGGDTVQNFVLSPAPSTVVNGVVKDGSGGDWPLYATVKVTGPGAPTFIIYTDPVTGYYTVTLAQGTTYTFQVNAVSAGYNPGGGSVPLILSAPQSQGGLVKNWDLTIDVLACNAPGYFQTSNGLQENFDAGSLPPGWTIHSNSGPGPWPDWFINTGADPCGFFPGNLSGGSGPYALSDSNCDGPGTHLDSELWTPSVDLSSASTAIIRFNEDYFALGDNADVDISTNGGTSWTNVLAQSSSARGPLQKTIDITSIAAGQPSVMARFHNYNANYAWWWQVDSVLVGQVGCLPGAGGLVVGNVRDGLTGAGLNGATVVNLPADGSTTTFPTPNDPNQDDGMYILFAQSGTQPFQASLPLYAPQQKSVLVVPNAAQRLDFSLASGRLDASPRPMFSRVNPHGTDDQTLNMTNTGTAPATFSIFEINTSAAARPVPRGPFANPDQEKANAERFPKGSKPLTDRRSYPIPGAPTNIPPLAAGDLLNTYPLPFFDSYGTFFNTTAGDVWAGNIGASIGGNNEDGRFLTDGTDTGDRIDYSAATLGNSQLGLDGTYNQRTGMLWQTFAGNFGAPGCLYEMDPVAKILTGKTICPALTVGANALAYDAVSDTFYLASLQSGTITHIDTAGNILDSKIVGLQFMGLAYNGSTHHLFAVCRGGLDVIVLDAANNYAIVGAFVVGGGGVFIGDQAGADIDCNGHLWLTAQSNKLYEVDSGETGPCNVFDIPWLSENPTSGTVPAAGSGATNPFPVAVHFDADNLHPGLRQGQLTFLTDTPYALAPVPVNFTIRFLDVPDGSFAENFIYGAAGAGIMYGCGGNNFCPNAVVTRADMAGYIERAVHGPNFAGHVYQGEFSDVAPQDYNAAYIQALVDDGITAGCGDGTTYCPNSPNTRAQMSVFIVKGEHGSSYVPPACTGVFADVPCPSLFADWIEQLAAEGVTVGCGGGNFCPNDPITQAQMAVFLVKAFNIPHL